MTSATQAIDEAAASDSGYENFFGSLRWIEAAGAAPEIREDFLNRIFSVGTGAGETARDRPDQSAEFVDAFRAMPAARRARP